MEKIKGQSLIEIVVAVGIIAVVLVGSSDLISRALNLASYQAGKNDSDNVAQYQLDYYRQQRDLNPASFFDSVSGYVSGNFDCVNVDTTKYSCSIIFDDEGVTNGVRMTVNVVWHSGDKNITTSLSQVLAKPTK